MKPLTPSSPLAREPMQHLDTQVSNHLLCSLGVITWLGMELLAGKAMSLGAQNGSQLHAPHAVHVRHLGRVFESLLGEVRRRR